MVRKNRFEHLKIDTKNILPQPWYNYPVLTTNYETIYIGIEDNYQDQARIYVGEQDGVYVAGLHFAGTSYLPGRKWGQFKSRREAILYQLGEMEAHMSGIMMKSYKTSFFATSEIKSILNKIKVSIFEYSCPQLELFPEL